MAIQQIPNDWRDDDSQHELMVPTDWLDQTCSSPGCSVVIRSQVGRQSATAPVCEWCQAGQAHYRKADSPVRPHLGPLLSRDEFGLDLYDAIVLQASMVMAQQQVERLRHDGFTKEAERVELEATDAERKLSLLLDKGTIAPNDVRRLLSIGNRQQEGAA